MPRTMTAEREDFLRQCYVNTSNLTPGLAKDVLLVFAELDAERAAHSQTIQREMGLESALRSAGSTFYGIANEYCQYKEVRDECFHANAQVIKALEEVGALHAKPEAVSECPGHHAVFGQCRKSLGHAEYHINSLGNQWANRKAVRPSSDELRSQCWACGDTGKINSSVCSAPPGSECPYCKVPRIKLTQTIQAAEKLAGALNLQVPSWRAKGCWCPRSHSIVQYGHSVQCQEARATLAQYAALQKSNIGQN